jgi:hypothetical protein
LSISTQLKSEKEYYLYKTAKKQRKKKNSLVKETVLRLFSGFFCFSARENNRGDHRYNNN